MDEVLLVLCGHHADAVLEGSDLLAHLHARLLSASASVFIQTNLLPFQAPRRTVVILCFPLYRLFPRRGFFSTDIVAELA